MAVYLAALLIGIAAGLRTFTAPAAVSWAAHIDRLPLQGSWLAFLGAATAAYILTLLAVIELVFDQLPGTPSRKSPTGFTARLVSGAISGAAIGAGSGVWIGGLVAGIIGAVIGTFGGYAIRMRLAALFGRDRTAAIIEDIVAVGGAILVLAAF
ncbi:MAG TPA: DUF4126 family protein [Stellaceae bacterium]|nr:DUF4126 family protein [Stellaceae bacterium]